MITGCAWTFLDVGIYETTCGNTYQFFTDLQTEMKSGFIWCPYCGNKIQPIGGNDEV